MAVILSSNILQTPTGDSLDSSFGDTRVLQSTGDGLSSIFPDRNIYQQTSTGDRLDVIFSIETFTKRRHETVLTLLFQGTIYQSSARDSLDIKF